MTPAVNQARKAGIAFRMHEYAHDAGHASYGLEAAEKLQVTPEQVFKTLIAQLDSNELVVALVPVSSTLNLKQLARAAQAKRAAMADAARVQRTTGYVLGGVSPLGQKKQLRTFIDNSATDFETVYVSAGRRGLEIELSANDLAELLHAQFCDLSAAG